MGVKILNPEFALGAMKSMGVGMGAPGLMDALQNIVASKGKDKEAEITEGAATENLRVRPKVGGQGRQVAYKKGGSVKAAASRIKSAASRRADGAAQRGKTKGRTL
jgi:hypothetical protein